MSFLGIFGEYFDAQISWVKMVFKEGIARDLKERGQRKRARSQGGTSRSKSPKSEKQQQPGAQQDSSTDEPPAQDLRERGERKLATSQGGPS
eukprot:gene30838-35877_t